MQQPGAAVLRGDDGRDRCRWVGNDVEYRRYHDDEWGRPLHGDQPLFEKLALEGFQAGLSWITILRRRNAFREAFAGFDFMRIAGFGSTDIDRLMLDAGIIRNRAKIEATISNARITASLVAGNPGALDRLVWSFAPDATVARIRPRSLADIPAVTPESTAASRALKAAGYRFVGPITVYALMQSVGMVDDHVDGCWRAKPFVTQ